MKVSACPACGAPVHPRADQCNFCQQYFVNQDPNSQPGNPASMFQGLLFQNKSEPNEGAFSLSIPKGWVLEGGIFRGNLMNQGLNAQFIEAKLDLSIKNSAEGTVMLRLCPEIKYCDMRFNPAGFMFPKGSTYSGMIVSPLQAATDFLTQMVFPWAHPDISYKEILKQAREPLLAENYRRKMAALNIPTHFQYDGGWVTFGYEQGGTRYLETGFTVIENLGPMGGGMWSNKDTVIIRAPESEFSEWEPVFKHITESIHIEARWLAGEIVSQEFLARSFLNAQQAQIAREQRMLQIQQQIQQVDREIQDHRMNTNAEIMNDNYLTLMALEEYVNPITNQVEYGSNQWQHRWVNNNGDEFYTDNLDHDPNIPGYLNCADWQRTPVRPRFPQ